MRGRAANRLVSLVPVLQRRLFFRQNDPSNKSLREYSQNNVRSIVNAYAAPPKYEGCKTK